MNTRRRRRSMLTSPDFTEDRQMAVQALLNRPFVSRQHDPETYQLVREHFRTLRDWFHEQTGWALIVTRQFAKLEKTPGRYQSWMAIEGFRDGRDYGYFTYGLWFLEGLNEGQQFLLSEMVEAIREHLVAAGLFVDWTVYDHRMSMARALKKLRELDVLVAVEGDETDWARVGDADVLYQASSLSRYVLQRLPDDIGDFASITMEEGDGPADSSSHHAADDASDGINVRDSDNSGYQDAQADPLQHLESSDVFATVRRRHRVMRRLLQEPVVYDWQWTEDERRYVQTQRASIIDRMESLTGLQGRRFREGLLFVWPDLTSESSLFPTLGVRSDIALLISAALAKRLQGPTVQYDSDENGCYHLTRSDMESLVREVREASGDYWSKEYRELSTSRVAEDAIAHICEWNLGAHSDGGGLVAYPALLRWAGEYEVEGSDGE